MTPGSVQALSRPHLSGNVVEVSGVSKKFSSTRSGARRNMLNKALRGFMGRPPNEATLHEDEFWALQNISFQLPRGKTLGVLGLNGAGKTTLLNIIGGMIAPDNGTVTTTGAIGALMNLSAGLQPTLSARENIIIGGAVRGWSMRETLEKYEDIVDFAELGDHMTRRLVDFSSGMRMRLAFSIAAHMSPDLLLIDEVLAVGDHRFRNKCQKKIKEITSDASVIIVSHSVRDIRDYCDECLLLRNGQQVFYGDVETGLGLLLDSYHSGSIKAGEALNDAQKALPPPYQAQDALKFVSHDWDVETEGGALKRLSCRVRYEASRNMNGVSVGLAFRVADAPHLLAGVSSVNEWGVMSVKENETQEVDIKVALEALNPGNYDVDIIIVNHDEILFQSRLGALSVPESDSLNWGSVQLDNSWSLTSSS